MSKSARYFTGVAVVALLGASAADAALTTTSCLAKKRQLRGKFQQCLTAAEVKDIKGKPADVGKCSTNLQEQLTKLNAKASAAGVGCRYLDNGDGTVTDFDTGLQWEMKDGVGGGATDSNQHDVDNLYLWSDIFFSSVGSGGNGTLPNGNVFTAFLATLNKNSFAPGFIGFACFANRCDWRLPTLSELQGILVAPCAGGTSCIDPIFGPVGAGPYTTSTQSSADQTLAWSVHFGTGAVSAEEKDMKSVFARAVRSGL